MVPEMESLMPNFMPDPACIDLDLDCRSISFENPTGGRGAGGTAFAGRKGAPAKLLPVDHKEILAEIDGPGRIRHIWMTFPPAPPEAMRGVWLEVYYDDLEQPSISVPCVDFFGLAHGRPVHYYSALTSVQEGRGFNAYFPMPFRKRVRVELTNGSGRPIQFYYQIDYTLEKALPDSAGYLLATFRRENPTTLKQDFVIAADFEGPGRFLGCAVGIRVLPSEMGWYGEGEFKVYRDGDDTNPTICGTGLEDYVGSAWGMGQHTTPYQGVPIFVIDPGTPATGLPPMPDFVSFYRWHVMDPIVFEKSIRVTIQQLGAMMVPKGEDELFERIKATHQVAGEGWITPEMIGMKDSPVLAFGVCERQDDFCATAFVYCRDPQPVPRLDLAAACTDIGRRSYESAGEIESMLA
jgi:hypothetical protein